MSRRASASVPILVLLAFGIGLPIAWRWIRPLPAVAVPLVIPPMLSPSVLPPERDLDVMLLRASLGPRELAAAAISPAAVASIVSAASTHVDAHPSNLSAADAAYAAAKVETDRLRRLIESGRSEPEDVQAFQSQSAALATATTQRDAALDAIFNAATESLTNPQRLALTNVRAQRDAWLIPVEYLVIAVSQSDYVELRSALANERYAAEYDEDMDPAALQLLTSVRANPAVASARTGIETNLAGITTAWNAAAAD